MDKYYAQYLLEKTKRDYDFIANDFSRTRKHPWEEMRFLFDNYLDPKDKVLDLGCGNGRYLPFFKEKEVDYYGVDSCTALINIAKEKYPEERFQTGDGLNLSFPDNFFDKVYNIAVLHQIPSGEFRIQFLKEIKRVLKPTGLVVLTVWKLHRLVDLSSLFKYTFLRIIGKSKLDQGDVFVPWGDKVERYYHYFSKKELEDLIKKVGFVVIKSGETKNKRGNRQNIYIIAGKSL